MAKVLNITRKQDRADIVRYEVLIEHQVDGLTVRGTFNLNYSEDPDQATLDTDAAKRVAACDLYGTVKQQIKNDNRAEASWIDQDGEVRVLLTNRFCPQGCVVKSLPELPLILARRPKQIPRPDVAAIVAKYNNGLSIPSSSANSV